MSRGETYYYGEARNGKALVGRLPSEGGYEAHRWSWAVVALSLSGVGIALAAQFKWI